MQENHGKEKYYDETSNGRIEPFEANVSRKYN